MAGTSLANEMIFFRCTIWGRNHVFVWALDREKAKRDAQRWLGGDPDKYVVEPLTNKGDRVKLDITLNV